MARRTPVLHLIDSSVYIFRSYFSLPDSIRDRKGRPANVIYGFTDFLISFLKRSNASHGALCFDESLTTSFRNEIDPDYKANRPPAPEDLKRQIQGCKEVGRMLGFPTYASDTYEADDLIGSLANQYRGRHGKSAQVCILSTDKDLLQVLKAGDEFWNYSKDERISADAVKSRMGVHPHQIADLLALTGDTVDNIKGMPGIGPGTAATLLDHYGDLDQLLDQLSSLSHQNIRGAKRFQRIIEENVDRLSIARKLTKIEEGLIVEKRLERLTLARPHLSEITDYLEELGVGQRLLGRLETHLQAKDKEAIKKPTSAETNGATKDRMKSGRKKSAPDVGVAVKKKSSGKSPAPGGKKQSTGRKKSSSGGQASGKKRPSKKSRKGS
jgi:DNA polymerase-1